MLGFVTFRIWFSFQGRQRSKEMGSHMPISRGIFTCIGRWRWEEAEATGYGVPASLHCIATQLAHHPLYSHTR